MQRRNRSLQLQMQKAQSRAVQTQVRMELPATAAVRIYSAVIGRRIVSHAAA